MALLTLAGRVLVRGLRLPIDLILLTIDFIRLLLWVGQHLLLRLFGLAPRRWGPFIFAHDGLSVCTAARKYGNPVVFRCLCPHVHRDGASLCSYPEAYDRDHFPLSWVRMLSLGLALVLLWGGVIAGATLGCRHLSHVQKGEATASAPLAQPRKAGTPAHRAPVTANQRDEAETTDRDQGCNTAPTGSPKSDSKAPFSPATQASPAADPVSAPTTDQNAQARADQFVRSGDHYFAQGKYREAIIEYRNAIKCDTNSARAYSGVGQCCLQLNKMPSEARHAFHEALRLDPGLYAPHVHLAAMALAVRDFRAAADHARRAAELDASAAQPHAILSACHQAQGDLPSALREANSVVSLDPGSAGALVTAAGLHQRLNAFAEAERCYRRALDIDPDRADARIGLARLLQAQGKTKEARQHIDAVLATNPEDVPAGIALAEFLVSVGKLPEAINQYGAVTSRAPRQYFARASLADLLMLTGQTDAAHEVATDLLEDHPGDQLAHRVLATLYFRKGFHSSAIDHCKKALLSDPKHVDTRRLMARAYLAKRDYDDAVAVLKKLVKQNPDHLETCLMLGRAHYALKQIDQAVACFQSAAQRHPKSPLPHIHIGELRKAQRAVALAIASYEAALTIAPGHPVAANNLAATLLDQEGDTSNPDFARAYELAAKLRERFPKEPTVADTFGWACFRLGDYEKAVEALEPVVVARPRSATPRYHLAAALFRAGKSARAKEGATIALSLSANANIHGQAKALLARIEEGLKVQ